MKRLKVTSFVLAILIFQVCGYILADTDRFPISKNSTQKSDIGIALNTKTGDVLVTWSSVIDNQNFEIVSSLLKSQGDGTFKVGEEKPVSGEKFLNREVSVAYNPSKNNFLIVWEQKKISDAGGSESSNIIGRIVNSKGKAKGKTIPLFVPDNNYRDSAPVAVFIPAPSKSPAASADYMVGWLRSGVGSGPEGFFVTLLNAKGKMTSKEILVLDSTNTDHLYVPNSMIASSSGDIYCGISGRLFLQNESKPKVWVQKLSSNGSKRGMFELDNHDSAIGSVRMLQLSGTRFIASWALATKDSNGATIWLTQDRLFKSKPRPQKKEFLPHSNEESIRWADLVRADDGNIYQVLATKTDIKVLKFSSKGKISGEPVSILTTNGNLGLGLFGAAVIGTDKILVVYTGDSEGVISEQIWGAVVSPSEVFAGLD